MLKGLHLTLLAGPVVPLPAPRVVIDALQSVKVISSAGAASDSGFELTFSFSSRSPLNTLFLLAGAQTPMLRVMIIATINSVPQVLMDGVMTNHQITPGAGGGTSTLTVMGKDLTKVMDLQDFGGLPYPAMPLEARVALIIAKYAPFGLIPFIIPSLFLDVPIPIERIPTHEGTDLAYIRRLAAEIGYVFYIEPGPAPGVNVAYFGPQIKIGVPQPALNIDMDAHTNVESLSFRFETAERSLPIVLIQNSLTKIPIPIPILPINPLQPPLGVDSRADHQDRGAARHRAPHTAAGARARIRGGVAHAGLGHRLGHARRAALRPSAAARGSWSACAAPGSRSTGSTTSSASPARSSAVSSSRTSRCRATGSSRSRRWCRHEPRTVSRQVPRHGAEQHRSDADRPPAGAGAGRQRHRAVELGDALRADRRHPDGHVRDPGRSAPASGSSSSTATPTIRSGSAASGAAPPKCRRWRG